MRIKEISKPESRFVTNNVKHKKIKINLDEIKMKFRHNSDEIEMKFSFDSDEI